MTLPRKTIVADKLRANIYKTRDEAGEAAAKDAADFIRRQLKIKQNVNIVFAAAPSQNETLRYLTKQKGIAWERVIAFHMDEYCGLNKNSPQSFGRFLEDSIFKKLPFKEVHLIRDSIPDSCESYAKLMQDNKPDIVLLGIGENAHIAFNDPHVADFNDKKIIKKVALDETCRKQQVHDGCFSSLNEVPTHAYTLTIPVLMSAKKLICTVPAASKAKAVVRTLYAPISEKFPATIMRTHDDAVMYLDADSGVKAMFKTSVITDEVSQDFDEACRLADDFGLSAVEIRSVEDTAFENFSDEQIARFKKTADKYGLNISAACASLFKCNISEYCESTFRKAVEVCKKFGCRILRGFSFYKDESFNEDEFVGLLKNYALELEKNGLCLVLENEPSQNLSSAKEVAKVVVRVGSPCVKSLWDPGNDLYDSVEIPYPEGYDAAKKYIMHIHIKDAKSLKGKMTGVAFGAGEVDYGGQFDALLRDDYNGYLVLETHYRKGSELSDNILLRPMGSVFSKDGIESTKECLRNMFVLMQRVLIGRKEN